MSNQKISALSTVTNGQGNIPDIRNLSAIPGVEGTGNAKISGEELIASIINQGSAAQGRVCFYGAGTGGQTSIGGSSGFSWDQSTDTLNIGTPNSAAGLEADVKLHGTYVTGSDQPKLTFIGGNNVAGSFEFKITTSTNGAAQTWILPQALPTAGQVLEANAVSTNDVTLSWVTAGSGGGSLTPTTQTTNYSASANDFVICNVTTSLRVTLPAAAAGAIVGVKYASQNAPTDVCDILTPSAGVTIDGVDRSSTALVLPSLNTYYELISDGTNWFIK